MEQGWVKIHRKLLENPIIKKGSYLSLWLVLLLKATHKESKFMWNSEVIIIKEGQLLTGRQELSKSTGIPESTVEDILKYLEKQQQIQQQKYTKFSVITIVNWKTYQKPVENPTPKQQQSNTYKNVKNEKKNTIKGNSEENPMRGTQTMKEALETYKPNFLKKQNGK